MTDTMTITSTRRGVSATPTPEPTHPTPEPTQRGISGVIAEGETARSEIRSTLMRRANAVTSQTQNLDAIHHENEAQLIKRQAKLDEVVEQAAPAATVVSQAKEIPWYERAWNATREVVTGGGKLVGDAGSWLVDTSVAAGKSAASFAQQVVTDPAAALERVKAAGSKVVDGVTTMAHAAGSKIESAATWVRDNGDVLLSKGLELHLSPIKAGWEVAKGLGNGALDCGAALVGQKSWSEVGARFMGSMDRAGAILSGAFQIVSSAAVMTWGAVKGLSDSLGVTQLLVGTYHSAALLPNVLWDLGKIAAGQGSFSDLNRNALAHLKGAADGVVGAGKCFVEVTGIADLYHAGAEGCSALAAYGRGDMAAFKQHSMMAAMHGTFAAMSAGAIAATVATAGAAGGSIVAVAAGRATLKQATKVVLKEASENLLKESAKEIGQAAVREVMESAPKVLATREGGPALLKQVEVHAAITGKSVSELAYKELLKVEARAGAVETAKGMAQKGLQGATLDGAKEIARDVGEARSKGLLKEMGLDNIVDKHTFALLTNGAEKDIKTLSKEIGEKYGLSSTQAKEVAKDIQGAIKSGKADTEIKKILEDGVSKPITESLQQGMESEYKHTMKKAVRGDLKELGEQESKQLKEAVEVNARKNGAELGKYQDDLVDAAWTGYKEGIEQGTRAIVREGIERAFKRFRDRDTNRRGAGGALGLSESAEGEVVALDSKEGGLGGAKKAAEGEVKGHLNVSYERTMTGPQGEVIHYTESFDSKDNTWRITDIRVEKTNAVEKTKAA